MLKVGVTGGIGSGKSTVCALFEVLSVPVFYADDAARSLMQTDDALRTAIIALFSANIYPGGVLDRAVLSSAVFGDAQKLAALNALVHPAAIAAAAEWMRKQSAPYSIKEAAIFFESNSHLAMDVMIGISAPKSLRLSRAMARSGMTEEAVYARMAQQMDDEEKMARCDFVIRNDDATAIIQQVLGLDSRLRAIAKQRQVS